MPETLTDSALTEMPDPRHTAFLQLVPAVRRAAAFRFRFVRCPDRRADLMAETVALAWAWYARLVARGKNPADFPAAFAALAARAVASGRRVAGSESVRDVLTRRCRLRHGYDIHPVTGRPPPGLFTEALIDNTRSPVPAQVQFRHDVPAWLGTLKPRDREVAVRLALGHGTGEVAGQFGLTAARVSQLRGELRRSFINFLTAPKKS